MLRLLMRLITGRDGRCDKNGLRKLKGAFRHRISFLAYEFMIRGAHIVVTGVGINVISRRRFAHLIYAGSSRYFAR